MLQDEASCVERISQNTLEKLFLSGNVSLYFDKSQNQTHTLVSKILKCQNVREQRVLKRDLMNA